MNVSHLYPQQSAAIERITPTAAVEIMRNPHNRATRRRKIEMFTAAMPRWAVNGETIIFAEDGTLLDGHHRMAACIKSGVAFDSWVVRGVPANLFAKIDTGASRSAADALTISGKASAIISAAVARSYVILTRGRYVSDRMTHDDYIELSSLPMVEHFTRRFVSLKNKANLPSAIAGASAALSEAYSFGVAESFFDGVTSGLGLTIGDPRYEFRERVTRSGSGADLRRNTEEMYILLAKVAIYYATGKKLKVLKRGMNEQQMLIK